VIPRPGPFADALLRLDLPALPEDRRDETVRFIERRMASLPEWMALGVSLLALAVRGIGTVAGHRRLAGLMTAHPLPVVGEYTRLNRSLGFAFVWETWPDTRPDGAPR
jgi:hypothetical protein